MAQPRSPPVLLPLRHSGHLAALFCATPARLSTLLAMVRLVLGAFVAAKLANIRAELADLLGAFAAARHVCGGEPADRGAVDIERDAARHHLHVGLLKTSRGAVVAGIGARVACVDAGLELLVCHLEELLNGRRQWRQPLNNKEYGRAQERFAVN